MDFIARIRHNAENYPDRIAVIDRERRITYGDFLNLVNSISHRLILKDRTPKVVFDLSQGIEAYALIVAVMNVGGTYCPLNPDAPHYRKTQIINEFNPNFIIVDTLEKAAEFHSDKAIPIENILTDKNYSSIEQEYNGEDIIYVIYTSGTTGTPKGVKICRKALNKFLEWSIPTYGAGEHDIWGQFSFLSFDLSIVDIFTCLCSGATLFAMNDIPAKKNRPAGVIEKERITIWHSIPSAVEFMMVNEKSRFYDFSSLRLLSFCGEPLRRNQVDFLFKKNPDLVIFNTYGPTEGTLFCTWQELRLETFSEFCAFTMSIGKAIPGWSLKLNPVEESVEYEVVIYGDYIGKGYLRTVVDTKFKTLEVDGNLENAFETGDLVKMENGNLYFSSRKDRQVKIKGYRIELDEIDFRINEFLGKTSVTIPNSKKDSLYSFIETNENVINEADLRTFLKSKLEPYKVPNAFYPISEIPRNQNQKVEVNKLMELLP